MSIPRARHTRSSAKVASLGAAALLACVAVLGTATSAAASFVQFYDDGDGFVVGYYADPGENNVVSISLSDDRTEFVVVDTGEQAESGAPIVIVPTDPTCTVGMTENPGDTLRCPAEGVTEIRIGVGDGPDSVALGDIGVLTSATVDGGEGTDQLVNNSETPTTFSGGPGADTIYGRYGVSDTVDYSYAAAGVNVNLRTGRALSDGDGSSDTLGDIDNVVGSNFDDTVQGDWWDNVLSGRNGIDTLSYSGASGVIVDLNNTEAQDTDSDGMDTLSDFQNVIGSAYGDTLTGDRGENVVNGAGGDDTVNGHWHDDTLIGGTGSDTASFAGIYSVDADLSTGTAVGSGGTDELTGIENLLGSSVGDRLAGNASNNRLNGGAGNDILNGRGGQDGLIGGADFNTVDYSSAPNGVTVDLVAWTATGDGSDWLNEIQNVTGSAYDDWITGNGNTNILDGSGGNDDITGGDGNDTVRGALGNDTLMVRDTVSDSVSCGPGTDSVTFDSVDTLAADCEAPPPAPLPTIRIADAGILEGNSGTRALSFRVSLSSSSADSVTVHWRTVNGTATAPGDFTAASGDVTFAPGQTAQTIAVTIKGDRLREPNQTFTVRLDNPQRATIADGRATGTIRNDDGAT